MDSTFNCLVTVGSSLLSSTPPRSSGLISTFSSSSFSVSASSSVSGSSDNVSTLGSITISSSFSSVFLYKNPNNFFVRLFFFDSFFSTSFCSTSVTRSSDASSGDSSSILFSSTFVSNSSLCSIIFSGSFGTTPTSIFLPFLILILSSIDRQISSSRNFFAIFILDSFLFSPSCTIPSKFTPARFNTDSTRL